MAHIIGNRQYRTHRTPRVNQGKMTPFNASNTRRLTILLLGILLIISGRGYADKIAIKALDIIYLDTQHIIASGNAELVHPSFTILADRITYDKRLNQITGQHNVELNQDNQTILSDAFTFNTKTNHITINELTVELTTQGNHNIVTTADSFSDQNHIKTGKNGRITTCAYDPPHYYMEAESFTIYPEKRIIGQGVTLVNPVLFLPLGFWSPAYVYDLGKRKIIYLMPVIGSNTIEGGFMKNQVDYVINDHWTGEAYLDYLSQLGIGLGTRLNYTNYENLEGSFYSYNVSGTPYNTQEWHQTVQLSPENTLNTKIQSRNMYLIQGGTIETDKHSITFDRKTLANTQKIDYSFQQTQRPSVTPKNYAIQYANQTDAGESVNVRYGRRENSTTSDEYQIQTASQWLGNNILNQNNISYFQQDLSASDTRKDSYLKSSHSFKKVWDSIGTLDTTFDLYFDTDNDVVTRDIQNHIVQKIPEINLSLNRFTLNDHWSLNQDLQYGHYTEQYYNAGLSKQRVLSDSRFKINQRVNGRYGFDFLNSQLLISSDYTQYFYTLGDQTYTLGMQSSYTTDTFSFLTTDTQYNRTWIPTDGNTPFYFDERAQQERHELKETITLYYRSPQKYAFKYSTGYNWVVDYQLDNTFELLIHPNNTFRSEFKTTYLLQQKEYRPLASRIDITPNDLFSTSIQTNYDLNIGQLINVNHVLSGSTSHTWENRWIFRAYFTYSPLYNRDYQLQTLSLTKDLHERKLTLMYNRLLEEYRFQFTINAFQDNNVGITTNKYESFRLEGLFDDASIQR